MMDEKLFEQNPDNFLPVEDVELEEYIIARNILKKNILRIQKETEEVKEYGESM